jgi:hypothetical protein
MGIANMSISAATEYGQRAAMTGRRRYRVFGAVLDSDLEFPELFAVDTSEGPTWTLRVAEYAPPPVEMIALGERQVGIEAYTLARTPTGYRLEYSHAGIFDVSADGHEITWYRRVDAILELVRSIVIGPAIALSLELAGLLCLHGSAVAIGDDAVVFLGPKHHGKSTLATALTAAGARLIGDDLIAVAPGPPAMVRPGVPSVRLWDDTVDALPVEELCATLVRGVKTTATGFADRAFTQGELRLAAVYLLAPTGPRDDFTCGRTRLDAAAAAIGLAHQTKLADSLVGMAAAGTQLTAAAKLAATVPVWSLSAVRDLGRLPAVVAQVMAWHSVPQ